MSKKINKNQYLDSLELSLKLDNIIKEQSVILKNNLKLSKKTDIKTPACYV